MNKLLYIDKYLARSEAVIIGILLIIMSALAFIQVITRYCFFYSIVWSEEVTRYCMIFMTFLGAAFAISKQDHINIDMFTGFFKRKTGKDFRHVLNFIILIFSAACMYFGLRLVMNTYASGQLTEATRIPMYLVYLVVEISLVLMSFHALVRLIDTNCDNQITKE